MRQTTTEAPRSVGTRAQVGAGTASGVAARQPDAAPQLAALDGIRFFAVFLIFLHHLWSIRYPTWALSPVVFQYLITPWLMSVLR